MVVGRLCRRRHDAADRRRSSCARRSTCARAARCSMSPPATAMSRWPPRAAGATCRPPTTCRRCSNAAASAPTAERLTVEFREADAEALPFADASFDVVVSTFGVMFTPDQDKAAAELLRVCKPRRQDRPRQLDAGRLHRPAVQDARQASAAAGRREIAGAVGHAGAAGRDVRRQGVGDRGRAADVRVPLSLAGAFARRLQDLLRADAEGVRGARRQRRRRRCGATCWR